MGRRQFSREFKVEAVRLVLERDVSVAQAARDLALHENLLRRWVKELAADPAAAFPGQGPMKPEQLEIERLRREVDELIALCDRLEASLTAAESTGARLLKAFLVEALAPVDGRELEAAQ